MTTFTAGQTVRSNRQDRQLGITKDKDYEVLATSASMIRIENDRGVSRWVQTVHFDAPYVAPAATGTAKSWIISLIENGVLKPATNPRKYVSESQAHAVAREMAEKNKGCVFVIFEATGFTFVPKTSDTIVHKL